MIKSIAQFCLGLLLFLCASDPVHSESLTSCSTGVPFNNFYLRKLIQNELVFTCNFQREKNIESEHWDRTGSAFICTIKGGIYLATNYHVIEEAVISKGREGSQSLTFENAYGRKLIITSPYYYKLEIPKKRNVVQKIVATKAVTDEPSYENEMYSCDDLVLIPIESNYLSIKPPELASRPAYIGESLYIYGNTEGQGFVNEKQAFVNIIFNEPLVGTVSRARSGNSGGPVLDADNCIKGIFTYKHLKVQNQNFFIRLDKNQVHEWIDAGQFKQYAFPSDTVNFYTKDMLTYYKPGEHHSRISGTQQPHLSIGSALGKQVNKDDIWSIREYTKTPLKCYNWDLIPEERLWLLCATYGQTILEFIPDDWFTFKIANEILAAHRERDLTLIIVKERQKALNNIPTNLTRDEKIQLTKNLGIFEALRCAYNYNTKGKNKMTNDGDIIATDSLIKRMLSSTVD